MSKRRAAVAPKPSRKLPVRSDFDRVFWLSLAVFLPATLLAYQPAWHGNFLWDDDGHVTKAALRSVSGIWRIWFEPGATQQYYPVVHTAFWLQWWLWGTESFGYHIVNILLHVMSAGLLVTILRRLNVPGAWLAGAIFALHPVHVESVAWVTELKNTLSGVFYLVAALLYLRFDQRRQAATYWAALAVFVLAVFSKSVTATLPLGLLVVFWWQRGRIEWPRDIRPLVPFLVIGIAVGAMTVWMERTFIGAEGAAFDFTFIERGLIAGRAMCFYLASLVWPVNLSFSYPRWHVSQAIWWQYLYPMAVAALLVALWFVRDRSRAPLAALLFFGITLGPALGFVNVFPFKYSFVADHFQYLASIGMIALGAAGATLAVDRWLKHLGNRHVWLALVMSVPLVTLTWRDSHAYVSNDVLYRTTIERSPESWLAHNNLAAILLDREPPNSAQALAHAREAVRLAPAIAATQFNLGLALEASGDLTGSIDAYRAAIDRATDAERNSSRIALVHEALARVLRSAGRTEESAKELALAGQRAIDAPDARIDAAIALLQGGRAEEAAQQLTAALQQAPNRMDARYALGLALEKLNQFEPAIAQFRAVIAATPAHAGAKQHLGRSLQSLGRRQEAIEAYQAALALDPTSADTHNDLGVALAEMSRFREAEPHFAEAVRLDPGNAEARGNLAKTQALIRRGGRGPGG